MSNLYSLIQERLRAHANRVLLQDPRDFTGATLDAHVARYANALLALGARPGERVAAQVDKSAENIFLYLATLRIGAVYLPLNSAYRAPEVEYFLRDARPVVFIAAPERLDELQPVASRTQVGSVATLGVRNEGTLPSLAAMQAEQVEVACRADDDLAVICYTSGTTGRSKGAMITHGNLSSNALTLIELWGFSDADVLLHALPLYHIHGLFVALHCALLSGANTLLQPKFDNDAVFAALPKATVMMGVPTFYTRMLSDARLNLDGVRHMRLFVSGSAPLLADTFAEFEARTGKRILERYGMTETGMIASNPLSGERRAGTVGLPLRGVQVRIAAAQDGVGVVEVKGPNVFKGYWNMPEKNKSEFRDGYFITGDLGIIEPDGYVRLVGRAKDLIISGGLNVYPKEIEDAIDALDGVIESAVFAIPHPDFGEAVAAAVTLHKNATLTPEAIIAQLRTQLAAFKTPKRVYVLDELPRNAMGKVQKALLREKYKTAFA